MTTWASVGSLIESHRAKGSRPDRRNFLSKYRPRSAAPQFTRRHPQLQSVVPNFRMTVPNFSGTLPNFPTAFPVTKTTVPILRKAVPDFRSIFPNFFTILPKFWKAFPKFSAAIPIYNHLFPRYLQNLLSREDREEDEVGANPAFSFLRQLRALRATAFHSNLKIQNF